jgi:DNA-binding transcriptional ArsR family regulator
MGIYAVLVPRASTTSDAFNAIAEPRRREIVAVLARSQGRERPVGELVFELGLPQPAVSKHLAVLRTVGIVSMAKRGRERVYRLEPEGLKPVHDWIKAYERLWTNQLDRIKQRAERNAKG